MERLSTEYDHSSHGKIEPIQIFELNVICHHICGFEYLKIINLSDSVIEIVIIKIVVDISFSDVLFSMNQLR